MRVTIDEEGRTQVKRRYVVSAPLSGKLLRIELQAGDQVAEGELLARLVPADAPLLDPRTRAEQEARLHAAEAAVSQAEANVARARVADASARDDVTRKRTLAHGAAPSRRTISSSPRARRRRARKIWPRPTSAARSPHHQLAEARAALAARPLGAASTSSRSWRRRRASVLRVVRESEGVVSAGTALVEVGDPSVLEVAADLLDRRGGARAPGHGRLHRSLGRTAARWRRACAASSRRGSPRSRRSASRSSACASSSIWSTPSAEWRALGDNFRVEMHIVVWKSRLGACARRRRAVSQRRRVGRLRRRRRPRARAHARGRRAVGREVEVRGGARRGESVVLRPGESLRDGMRVQAAGR